MTAERAGGRLDAFASALDRLSVEDLLALAARPLDPTTMESVRVDEGPVSR